jgi:hypothetical protein
LKIVGCAIDLQVLIFSESGAPWIREKTNAYIKEPGFTAKFDLVLTQTNLTTSFSAMVAENPVLYHVFN